jgi:hypothetical protein
VILASIYLVKLFRLVKKSEGPRRGAPANGRVKRFNPGWDGINVLSQSLFLSQKECANEKISLVVLFYGKVVLLEGSFKKALDISRKEFGL